MAEKRRHQKTSGKTGYSAFGFPVQSRGKEKIKLVLKCDTMGSVEALSAMLSNLNMLETDVEIIHSGVGAITKQDLLIALTGSRIVIGFNVGVAPKIEQWVKEHGVEVRLYDVIYRLAEDLKIIGRSLTPAEPEDKIIGKCEVIATFKSKKGGIILGCSVVEGSLLVGKHFRVITAMGPVHSGRIESLQVEKHAVREAKTGQQAGVQISGGAYGKIGDFIECYEEFTPKKSLWSPKGNIVHLESS